MLFFSWTIVFDLSTEFTFQKTSEKLYSNDVKFRIYVTLIHLETYNSVIAHCFDIFYE